MTWQTLASVVLTVLSIAAQVVALSEVRSWGQEKRQGIARRLRAVWWSLTGSRPATHGGGATLAARATITASGYVTSSNLADLASFIDEIRARIASLPAASQEVAAAFTELTARVERTEAFAAEQTADARLAGAWVIAGAALAVLAVLLQAFA